MSLFRTRRLALLFGGFLLLSSLGCHGLREDISAGSGGSVFLGPVEIQIRSGSRTLPTFLSSGQTFVLGEQGMSYSILVRNRTHERVEALVSVDGRDVISGQQVRDSVHRGYILNPYRHVDITGFRQSEQYVATFRFSPVHRSYSARMGGSWHAIGTIRVAIFRENRPIAYYPHRPLEETPSGYYGYRRKYPSAAPKSGAGPAPSSPPADSKPDAQGEVRSEASKRSSAAGRSADEYVGRRYYRHPPRHQPGLGTAYGESRYAPARYTTFERISNVPSYQRMIAYNNCAGFCRHRIYSPWCPCYRPRPIPYRQPLEPVEPPAHNGPYAPPPPAP